MDHNQSTHEQNLGITNDIAPYTYETSWWILVALMLLDEQPINHVIKKEAWGQGQSANNGMMLECRAPTTGVTLIIHGLPWSESIYRPLNQDWSSTIRCVPWSTAHMRLICLTSSMTHGGHLRHVRRPLIIMKRLSQGFTTLHKASHAARIPWQGNQRLRSTANDRYRPHSSFVTHNRRRPTNNLDETVSPSVRPSVRRGAFVLRYIVQARLLRETNGAPLVHSTPWLNSCEREIHRSPELKHPELRVLPDYLHCTTTLLASTLTASLSEAHTPNRQL